MRMGEGTKIKYKRNRNLIENLAHHITIFRRAVLRCCQVALNKLNGTLKLNLRISYAAKCVSAGKCESNAILILQIPLATAILACVKAA